MKPSRSGDMFGPKNTMFILKILPCLCFSYIPKCYFKIIKVVLKIGDT